MVSCVDSGGDQRGENGLETKEGEAACGLDFSGVWVGGGVSGVTGCEYRTVENSDTKIGDSQAKGEQNPIIIPLRRSPAFRNSFSQRQKTSSSPTLPHH